MKKEIKAILEKRGMTDPQLTCAVAEIGTVIEDGFGMMFKEEVIEKEL